MKTILQFAILQKVQKLAKQKLLVVKQIIQLIGGGQAIQKFKTILIKS